MSLISIPLAQYTAQFRPLTWGEHYAITQSDPVNFQKATLARALVQVDQTKVTEPEAALKILNALPKPFLYKVWLLYKDGLPQAPFYLTRGLYSAPPTTDLKIKAIEDEEVVDAKADAAIQQLATQFGAEDIRQVQTISQKILDDAKKRGLQPATEEKV